MGDDLATDELVPLRGARLKHRARELRMAHANKYDQASTVSAERGEVIVDGPDGVAVSFTPEAAVDTAMRLLDAAAAAHGDQAIDNGRTAAT